MPKLIKAATSATSARKLNVRAAKPAAPIVAETITTPADSAELPVITVETAPAADTAPAPVVETVKPSYGATRLNNIAEAVIARPAHMLSKTSRNDTYFSFYAAFAKANGGAFDTTTIAASGRRPPHNGSNTPCDISVLKYMHTTGLFITTDGRTYTATEHAKSLRAYVEA